MASVLLSRTRDSVSETQANINVTASNFNLPTSTDSKKYSNKQYQYSRNNSTWYNMSSNTTTVNINKGETLYKSVTIYCRIVYTIDYYTYKEDKNEQGIVTGGSWVWSGSGSGASSSQSNTINIYFHPGSFSMGAVSGQTNPNNSNSIIKNVLTAEKINLWASHLQAAYRWYQQDDVTFSYVKNNKLIPLTVSQNDIITAEWFEACLAAMRAVGKTGSDYTQTITGGPTGTLITADCINLLDFSGTS